MSEIQEVKNKIQESDKTVEGVKQETIRLLEESNSLIEKLAENGRNKEELEEEYQKIKEKTILSIESESEITYSELDILRKDIISMKVDEKGINKENIEIYSNIDLLINETDKNNVLATLSKFGKEYEIIKNKGQASLENSYIDLSKISPSLRGDLDVILATRFDLSTISPEEISIIPDEFFKNEANLKELFKISNQKDFIKVVSGKIGNKKTIEFLIKNNLKIDISNASLELLEADSENKLEFDLIKKQDLINELQNTKNKSYDDFYSDQNLDNVDKIELFLENHSINEIPEDLLIDTIFNLKESNELISAKKLLTQLEKKDENFFKYLIDGNLSIIEFLPPKIKENIDFQKYFIDKALKQKEVSSIQKYLSFINFDNIDVAIYLYKNTKLLGEEKLNNIFEDKNLNEKMSYTLSLNSENNDIIYEEMVSRFIVNIERFNRIKEESKKIKEENEKEKNINNKESSKSESSNNEIVRNSNGSYRILTEKGKEIEISENEKNIIEGNEEAKENLINFKETLDSLNISELWEYRDKIFESIKSKNMLTFDLNDDYLGTDEITLFLKTILKSIQKEDLNRDFSLMKEEKDQIDGIQSSMKYENVFNLFRNLNKFGAILKTPDVTNNGLSRIGEIFTQMYNPRGNLIMGFRNEEFRKNIE